MDYKITNIKISVKCKNICLDSVEQTLCEKNFFFSKYNNYMVIKHKYTYILFKKNVKKNENVYHVNVTKLNNIDCLSEAINNIKHFSQSAVICSYTIDNITVSKSFDKSIKILDLITKIPLEISVTYNSETFPGVFLKYPNKTGTAILFHTGKCVLLGCRNITNIESIVESLLGLIK
jgi:Transcription factor TFIID (or TATA-binding protein, TBP)